MEWEDHIYAMLLHGDATYPVRAHCVQKSRYNTIGGQKQESAKTILLLIIKKKCYCKASQIYQFSMLRIQSTNY